MKKNTVIILFLILALVGAFCLASKAQDSDPAPSNSQTIADETTISFGKTTAKIECSNETIASKLLNTFGQLIKSCSWKVKTDRHGPYKEYTLRVTNEDGKKIKEWAHAHL